MQAKNTSKHTFEGHTERGGERNRQVEAQRGPHKRKRGVAKPCQEPEGAKTQHETKPQQEKSYIKLRRTSRKHAPTAAPATCGGAGRVRCVCNYQKRTYSANSAPPLTCWGVLGQMAVVAVAMNKCQRRHRDVAPRCPTQLRSTCKRTCRKGKRNERLWEQQGGACILAPLSPNARPCCRCTT